MDHALFQLINDLAGQWGWLDALAVFCAQPLIFIMGAMAALLVLSWWAKDHRPFPLILGVLTIIFNEILVHIAKLAFAHDRPFLVLQNVHVLVNHPVTHAFPSGHTAAAFAIATSVWLCNRRWGVAFLIVAIMIGASRIFVGVHWPLDVLAGAVLGSGVAWAIYALLRRLPGGRKQKLAVK